MSNFIIDCINGDTLMLEINDYIDRWHDGNTELALHDFLGMTKKEYALFVEDENYLGSIISAHKFNKSVVNIVKDQIAMAARSDDAIKAKRLQKWLENEGLWA